MADPFDIRTFTFPTLADFDQTGQDDVLSSVQILRKLARGETDQRGRQTSRFKEADREKFQREALTGDSRLNRVLATLDAIVQRNPAALFGAAPGPLGMIGGLANIRDMEQTGRKPGDIMRTLARVATQSSDPATRIRDLVEGNPDVFTGNIRSGDRETSADRRGPERELTRERTTGRASGPV